MARRRGRAGAACARCCRWASGGTDRARVASRAAAASSATARGRPRGREATRVIDELVIDEPDRAPTTRAAGWPASSTSSTPSGCRSRDALARAAGGPPGDVHVTTIGVRLGARQRPLRARAAACPLPGLLQQRRAFDVGIAPLSPDLAINHARSSIKLKEYAALGVPWLASPIGPYAGLGEREGGRLVAARPLVRGARRARARRARARRLARRAARWGRSSCSRATSSVGAATLAVGASRTRALPSRAAGRVGRVSVTVEALPAMSAVGELLELNAGLVGPSTGYMVGARGDWPRLVAAAESCSLDVVELSALSAERAAGAAAVPRGRRRAAVRPRLRARPVEGLGRTRRPRWRRALARDPGVRRRDRAAPGDARRRGGVRRRWARRLRLENMDARKHDARTVGRAGALLRGAAGRALLLRRRPCAAARSEHGLAHELLDAFGDRLAEVHVSSIEPDGDHVPLRAADAEAFLPVLAALRRRAVGARGAGGLSSLLRAPRSAA